MADSAAPREDVQEQQKCCTAGPVYSSSGMHTFVHCPNLCKTCAGIARLEHPYLVCAWNNTHGMVEQGLTSNSPPEKTTTETEEHSEELVKDHELETRNESRTCFTCNIRCTNVEQLKEHMRGKRHQRQVYLQDQQEQQQNNVNIEFDNNSEDNQDQELFYRCKKRKGQFPHYASSSQDEQQQQDGIILLDSNESRRKFMRLKGQVPSCEVCNVVCTSWGVLEDHFESKRHLGRIKHLQSQARCGNEQACSRLEALKGQMRIVRSQYR